MRRQRSIDPAIKMATTRADELAAKVASFARMKSGGDSRCLGNIIDEATYE